MPLIRTQRLLAAFLLAFTTSVALRGTELRLAAAFRPTDPSVWPSAGEQLTVALAADRPATAIFTVPAGAAGFYAVVDSHFRREATVAGRVELGLQVAPAGGAAGRLPPPAVRTTLEAGELFDFDAFLGYLDAGDEVRLTVGPADDGAAGDAAGIDGRIVRVPSIPVSVFPDDLRDSNLLVAPGAWSLADEVLANSPAARTLAWGRGARAFTFQAGAVRVDAGAPGREPVAAFRVPQSGYYALHDAWVATRGGAAEARIYVGDESEPRRTIAVAGSRASLNADLGYLAKGEVLWLAFRGAAGTAVEFAGSVVEWAPRRAPLRVKRGSDGLLDVFEPEAPRRAVDIPAARWITVPARDGDATEAIRAAFAAARDRRRGADYAGVRLEAGQTYVIASQQPRGPIFGLRGAERIVFDGNGATLRIGSPELTRAPLELFSLSACRNLAFADFTAVGAAIPFTTGAILDVSPRGESTQTVTFRVDAGELDPLKDISRDGRNNAYAYDPLVPGRLALGTWTHYPGSGNPSIQATDTPGVFTHRVTRTDDSIEPGGKWLIKNKNAGVIYLETRSGTENITLSGIDGRAAGGGQLRFWQTSGINLLDCRFEPDGDDWISSSADGVHGRGREGVWIENTLIRGICEDIMNTYGQNMAVEADDNPADAVMSIRMFERSSESASRRALRMPTDENVAAGDQLVFFNPLTGRVLGYAGVVAVKDGRYTLTNPVPGVDSWEEADGRNATMVYNTRVAGRFFVRDSRFMDSMRFGIYIKARGGVIFGSQFEGLSGPAILGMNEPEWPEGPPPTHVWVQGCVFSQNNYGYMPRHRDYVVVDPADISVYTRHFRDPAVPDDFRAFITRGQFANSHVKLLGNVFHAWRGMGISVRNAKNVRLEDNLFLPPVADEVMRRALADDPPMAADGRGRFAAIHLDSVAGVRLAGNRFHGLPPGDRTLAQGADVTGLVTTDNAATSGAGAAAVALSFDEWFGDTSREAEGVGAAADTVALGGAEHRAGRLGAGLHFPGGGRPAVLAASTDTASATPQLTVALWVCPERATGSPQAVLAQGGVTLVIAAGRWKASVGDRSLDLGPVRAGLWQHVALVLDGKAQSVRGFIDGGEVATGQGQLELPAAEAVLSLGSAEFHGSVDEFRLLHGVPGPADLAALALRKAPGAR